MGDTEADFGSLCGDVGERPDEVVAHGAAAMGDSVDLTPAGGGGAFAALEPEEDDGVKELAADAVGEAPDGGEQCADVLVVAPWVTSLRYLYS